MAALQTFGSYETTITSAPTDPTLPIPEHAQFRTKVLVDKRGRIPTPTYHLDLVRVFPNLRTIRVVVSDVPDDIEDLFDDDDVQAMVNGNEDQKYIDYWVGHRGDCDGLRGVQNNTNISVTVETTPVFDFYQLASYHDYDSGHHYAFRQPFLYRIDVDPFSGQPLQRWINIADESLAKTNEFWHRHNEPPRPTDRKWVPASEVTLLTADLEFPALYHQASGRCKPLIGFPTYLDTADLSHWTEEDLVDLDVMNAEVYASIRGYNGIPALSRQLA